MQALDAKASALLADVSSTRKPVALTSTPATASSSATAARTARAFSSPAAPAPRARRSGEESFLGTRSHAAARRPMTPDQFREARTPTRTSRPNTPRDSIAAGQARAAFTFPSSSQAATAATPASSHRPSSRGARGARDSSRKASSSSFSPSSVSSPSAAPARDLSSPQQPHYMDHTAASKQRVRSSGGSGSSGSSSASSSSVTPKTRSTTSSNRNSRAATPNPRDRTADAMAQGTPHSSRKSSSNSMESVEQCCQRLAHMTQDLQRSYDKRSKELGQLLQ